MTGHDVWFFVATAAFAVAVGVLAGWCLDAPRFVKLLVAVPASSSCWWPCPPRSRSPLPYGGSGPARLD